MFVEGLCGGFSDVCRGTLYKIINVSPIQGHPYQTSYGGAELTKV
jgi:hypothetical protein